MSDDRLIEKLAAEVFGWRTAPGRFIKPGRSWAPRHRFAPLTRLDDAFQLVDQVATTCKLTTVKGGPVAVEVQVGARVGKASGKSKARTVTMALVSALGLDLPNEVGPVPTPGRSPRNRSRIDGV
jgi:hypothetical protein